MSDIAGDDLPDDADGDALRRLLAANSDLTREMEIDFFIAIDDETSANEFAKAAESHGFESKVSRYEELEKAWTCYCTKTMIPSYESIVGVQDFLAELGRPWNAEPDGWGSFGNAPEPNERA